MAVHIVVCFKHINGRFSGRKKHVPSTCENNSNFYKTANINAIKTFGADLQNVDSGWSRLTHRNNQGCGQQMWHDPHVKPHLKYLISSRENKD